MKFSLYFIFYVAMILELLIFILERDEAADQHLADVQDMITLSENLTREFQKPLDISVPPTTTSFVYSEALQKALGQKGESTHVVLSPVGLWSDVERQHVEFTLYDSAGRQVGVEARKNFGRLDRNPVTGDATFSALFEREGIHRFTAVCKVRRSIPPYYPDLVKESVTARLADLLGPDLWVSTAERVPFTVQVRTEGHRLPPCEYCGQGPYRK